MLKMTFLTRMFLRYSHHHHNYIVKSGTESFTSNFQNIPSLIREVLVNSHRASNNIAGYEFVKMFLKYITYKEI